MEQKRVSFKVAQAIKEAGYPQEGEIGFSKFGEQITDKSLLDIIAYDPTYLDVWLWLWREKKICINCKLDKYNLLPMWWCTDEDGINYNVPNFADPEEAIITAIEYLVDNNLIK